jgi:sRNA-binding protein
MIRQEHNAAVQLLRNEASRIRGKLIDILEQKEIVNAQFKQASESAARLEAPARQARAKAAQAAQNISRATALRRSSLQRKKTTTTTTTTTSARRRPPTRRR